jgi:hypothetical protein
MARWNQTCVLTVMAGLFTATASVAQDPTLIAIGTISGTYEDFATRTAAPLENGIAGNLLGGMGSGLTYAGGNIFLALPDRGPNAKPYNKQVDDTASYINRFHAVHLTLAPSGNPDVPFTLTPMVVRTTLLSSDLPLFYSTGTASGLGSGVPTRNAIDHTFYFTGRSDTFNPFNARFDTEGIRVSNDGDTVFITDEYGPYVYAFDRASGKRVGFYTLPAKFAVAKQSALGDNEISGNTSGRVANKGMEGLAITPDGKTLVGIMQSPLLQDGGTATGLTTRIVTIDVRTGHTREFAYPLDTVKTTVSEIVAVNNHQFLVDERDSKGLGDDSVAVIKKIYKIDLAGAMDVSNISGGANLAAKAVTKTLFLDVVAALAAKGIAAYDVPAKLEGITFGQDVAIAGQTKHTLYIANDNDYSAVVPNSHHAGGAAENPNKLFVFAFDDDDLPDFVPQQFRPDRDRDRGRDHDHDRDHDREHDRDDHDRDDHDHDRW